MWVSTRTFLNALKVIDDDSKHQGKSSRISSNGGNDSSDNDHQQSHDVDIKEEVQRSTIEEAEVGVKLQPISSLVDGNVGLRRELQN